MTTPDKAELGSKLVITPENPKRSGHLPRWLRVPACVARTSLAILTTVPGAAIAADAINRIENPYIIIAASAVDFSLDSRLEPPGLNTNIDIVAGQQINIKASGRARFAYSQGGECARSTETDPDGNRYLGKLTCPSYFDPNAVIPTAAIGQLIARIEPGPWFPIGNNYKGSLGSSGRLFFLYNDVAGHFGDNTGSYNITVDTDTPLLTATPDAAATKLAGIQKANEEQAKKNAQNTAIAAAQATGTALSQPPSSTPDKAATDTPAESAERTKRIQTATAIAKENEDSARFRGQIQATATEDANQTATTVANSRTPTPTIIPIPTPTPTLAPLGFIDVVGPQIRVKPGITGDTFGPTVNAVKDKVIPVGIAAAFLAGLTANEIYKRWRFRKGVSAGATTGTAGSTGSSASQPYGNPSNPNTAPSTGPARPKNPEWVIGQQEFQRRWQAAKSKFSPVRLGDNGNEPEYILDHFKIGMNVVHEVLLEDATNIPEMDTRVRAGIEYLIPEIWPTNEIFKRFFDPSFNAGYFTPEDLAKIFYLPEQYRNLSIFTKGQKRDINRIRRILLHALHPDLSKSEADPKLQARIDTLLKQLNSTWPLINKLLS